MKEDLKNLLALYDAATPGDLDSAQYKESDDNFVCPFCEEGTVDGTTFTNYDDKAVGVQFFGVGPEFGRNEALFRGLMTFLNKHRKELQLIAEKTDA